MCVRYPDYSSNYGTSFINANILESKTQLFQIDTANYVKKLFIILKQSSVTFSSIVK